MFFNETNNYFDMDKSNNTNVNIDTIIFNREETLYKPFDGFNKGNMFPEIYSKYKNHIYKLKVSNPKDDLLYKIQMYSFALKDYSLYLDTHPEDTKILREFRDTNQMYMSLKEEYESKYGPLCITSASSTSKWAWLNEPWPWDKGGNN